MSQVVNYDRWMKLIRKFSWVIMLGLRPTALQGRFDGPKVMINSIPKSGTNLLEEILHYCPLMRGKVQKTLLPTLDEKVQIDKIRTISKGQCIPAHLYFSEALLEATRASDVKIIFVVRDLRDSMLSHITYLEKIDYTHPHSKIFEHCTNLDDKLDVYLNGIENFEPWSTFVQHYHGWLSDSDNILTVKFEDLIDTSNNCLDRKNTLKKIAGFLELGNINVDYLAEKMINENGLTYNAPSVNKWKKILSDDQIKRVNRSLSKELRLYGYKVD